MKLTAIMLSAIITGAGSAAVVAADCTSSFYCYGKTGNAVTRVATRPPPIPPPNPRVAQQRRQQQLAMRTNNNAAARTTTRPAPQAAPRPAPRANVRATPAPQPRANVRVTPPQPARAIASCQNLNDNASKLESQAVIASKVGDRNNSVRLFREAGVLRKQASTQNCR